MYLIGQSWSIHSLVRAPALAPSQDQAWDQLWILQSNLDWSNNSSSSSSLTSDPNTVDYNSSILSVFPAEACEVISGYACSADIYPEVKLDTKPVSRPVASEPVDREYEEYNSPKTVFREEACDDLGGEFCEPDFQKDAN